ncbi:hypothetical protein [Kiloniella laminariae]|uniref:hypothetical protein n=1 Tax=Kiloniella laminariae TaxID=454162 RepID=UPI00036DD32B|nr:hypothetical protein [Kiloniella laminariae]
MAEEFHILDFSQDNQIDAKEFSRRAEIAASLTEDFAMDAGMDALNTLLLVAKNVQQSTAGDENLLQQSRAIAADTLDQATLMIEEVERFKNLSAELSRHC